MRCSLSPFCEAFRFDLDPADIQRYSQSGYLRVLVMVLGGEVVKSQCVFLNVEKTGWLADSTHWTSFLLISSLSLILSSISLPRVAF